MKNQGVFPVVPLFGLLLANAIVASGCHELRSRSPEEKLWRKYCADCHGLDGRGNTPRYMGNPAADLTDEYWKNFSGNRYGWEQAIREGVPGAMPPNDQLSNEEIKLLVRYLAELRGETQ